MQGPDDEYRAKVNILSTVDGGFKVGDMVSFEATPTIAASRLLR